MNGKEYLNALKNNNKNKMNIEEVPDFLKKELGVDVNFIETYGNQINADTMETYFQELTNNFIKYLPSDVQQKLNNVVVGIIPSFTVNASAIIDAKCDDYVIILHTQLLAIISQFCELQMFIWKFEKKEDIKKEFYCELKKIVNCYMYPNYALRLEIMDSQLSFEELAIVTAQTTIMEMFIIAHELAHIYLGHCDSAKCKTLYLTKECSLDVLEYNKIKEFEADVQAFKWLIKVLRNEEYSSLPPVYKGNEMFAVEVYQLLHLIEVSGGLYDDIMMMAQEYSKVNDLSELQSRFLIILKRIEDIIAGKDYDKRTHPLAMERLGYLILEGNFDKKNQERLCKGFLDGMNLVSYDIRTNE